MLSKLALDSLSDFQIIKTIAFGGTSRVVRAYIPALDIFCALKILPKHYIVSSPAQEQHTRDEIKLLDRVQHPFIVQKYGHFQDAENVYIALELVEGGELFAHLQRFGSFDVETVRFYAAEVLAAIDHLHRLSIGYRDLKPENIVLTVEGHVKLIDLGFAKEIDQNRAWSRCGTPEYLPPEVIRGEGASLGSDWWSFGILVYEMLVGSPPFRDEDEVALESAILNGEYTWPDGIPQGAREFVDALLQTNVSQRLGCTIVGGEEIKQHPWFEGIDWDYLVFPRYGTPFEPGNMFEMETGDEPEPECTFTELLIPEGYVGPVFSWI
jgi:serine/threonine protein kinase